MQQEGIIKHWGKIKAMRTNAQMIFVVSAQNPSFGTWLADWPSNDITGLWLYLKKNGSQLGGASAASFMRMAGKDTFLLTEDVWRVVINEGVTDKPAYTLRNLAAIQALFNEWQQQSGLPLSHISRIVSMTVGH